MEIAYECFGDPGAPPLLLVMGLATQMLGWADGFCTSLVDRGLHVIRFDNRDVGLSTHLRDAPAPDLMAVFSGDTASVSYTLSEMAEDTVGLLDALDLDSAHIVGASMGGMIAQAVAIEHPERVRSLTSIMSTTGDQSVGQPTDAALAVVLSPPAKSRQEAVERTLSVFEVIGSPGFELDQAELAQRAAISYDRAHDPVGVARQLAAVIASPDRASQLGGVDIPALVMHGTDDPLIDVSGGRATAEAIPHADLAVFEGMGHDLPRALWPEITARISALVQRAEGAVTARE